MPADDARREVDQLAGVPAPEQTPRLFGHETELENMLDAYDAGHLHHGWLVHGPRGIGKSTFAYELAKRVLARSSDEGKNRIFSQLSAGAHPNLATLRIGRNPTTGRFRTEILVDELRGATHRFEVSAGRRGARFLVVDCIEDLNRNAANALLKTLEEPPENCFFLLVSQRPGQILSTIRSRTLHLPLRPLSQRDTKASVRAALGRPAMDEALGDASARSGGRPRIALEILLSNRGPGLDRLVEWLADAKNRTRAGHLPIAAEIAKDDTGAYVRALRELLGWIAANSRSHAVQNSQRTLRLEGLTRLWEWSEKLANDQAIYNLDRRQTLVMIMDAICDLDRL
jgi:DNA polymerase III subunit delta'